MIINWLSSDYFHRTHVNIISIRSKIDILIEENLDYLFRFAFFRIGNRQDAEDIVQNAFLKILQRGDTDVRTKNIRMYMFRIVLNMCIDYQREKRNEIPLDDIDLPEYDDSDDELNAEYDRIQSLLGGLSEKESEVIRMRAVDELSFVEIGQILNMPVTTIQYRYKSGMDKLKGIVSKSKYE